MQHYGGYPGQQVPPQQPSYNQPQSQPPQQQAQTSAFPSAQPQYGQAPQQPFAQPPQQQQPAHAPRASPFWGGTAGAPPQQRGPPPVGGGPPPPTRPPQTDGPPAPSASPFPQPNGSLHNTYNQNPQYPTINQNGPPGGFPPPSGGFASASPPSQGPPPSGGSPPQQGGGGGDSTAPRRGGTHRPGYYAPAAAAAATQGRGNSATGGAAYPEYPGYGAPASQPGFPGPGGQIQADAKAEEMAKECEQFNSPPAFVRPSMGRMPNSHTMKQKCQAPLGLLFQPLSDRAGEIPSVNFGSVGTVVRCKRCRTYINPFAHWEANGRRWVCNLCGYFNDTPNHYYHHLDEAGKRADRFERPELSCGSVEYVAPGEYMVRPPQPPAFLFVIEATVATIQNGLLETAIQGVKAAIQQEKMPGGGRCSVGIITFDTAIHFYNFNASLSQAQMVVVADLEDFFCPLPVDDIMTNLADSEKMILALLDALPMLHRETKTHEAALGSAVRAAHQAIKHIGGKILVFASSLPTVGENQLKGSRYNPRLLNTEREVELLKPVSEAYKNLAVELTRVQVSVELFLCPQQYIDAASLAPLVKFTGGDAHVLPGFSAQAFGDKLREEILHVIQRSCGWEAVMRIRVSRGWRITHFFGHLYIRGMDLLVIPNCHHDQTFGVLLDMEENVIPEPIVCVQCALLYTNSDGERRIRVHTHSIPVTQNFQEVVASLDPQAATCLMAQQAIDQALKGKFADARTFLQNMCYQIYGSSGSSPPDAVRVLPLYIMGMLKSAAFRATNDVSPDQRIASWLRLESLPVDMQACYFYPRLVCIHMLEEGVGVADQDGNINMPQSLNLTAENMSQDGAYLLEDGETILLWIGRGISPNWLWSVFGAQDLNQLDSDLVEQLIGTTGDPMSARVAAIIQQMRRERSPTYMKLVLLKQGDPNESRFFASLVEDRTLGLQMTLNEFLSKLGGRPAGMTQQPPAQQQRAY